MVRAMPSPAAKEHHRVKALTGLPAVPTPGEKNRQSPSLSRRFFPLLVLVLGVEILFIAILLR